ncbi:MAG: site-specific integrase [Bdellovibrionaceae bacterium]|nr:site-specific integrase [Pseudobdellovibrionaceae bacterium]
MGIKLDIETNTFSVIYSKRHPKTRVPVGLRRKGIKTKQEAKRVYDELVVQVDRKIREQIVPTWKSVIEDYISSLQVADITNTTRYNREKLLRYHTIQAWGSKHIDEITTDDIHRLLNDRLLGNAESHRKFFIKCVRGVFQFALEKQLINRNPTPMLKFKIKSKIKKVLNEDQILSLLKKAQDQEFQWYPHYSVALFTGLRNGELYALRWNQVNLEKRQILVNCSWSSKDGFKSTKSGDDRIVEIPMPLLPLLRELKLKSADSDFVLPRLSRWDRGEQAYDLRLFLRSNDLPEVRFHDLRASWATLLLDKDVPPAKVMAMGGWSDLKTMMIYMRKAGISIRNSTSVLDGLETHNVDGGKVVEFRSV